MKKIVIGDIVSRAWDLAVKHWPIFVLFNIVSSLLSSGMYTYDSETLMEAANAGDPSALLRAYAESVSFNPLWGTICILLTIYLEYILLNLYVNVIRFGKPYETMSQIFKVDINQLAIYFAVNVVYAIIIVLGGCIFIIPGIWFAVRLIYAPMLAATQGASFGEAFSRSWQMTKGNFWNLLLLGIVAILIAIMGFVACCVGYLFAAVIVEFMLVLSFYVLKPVEAPEVSAEGVAGTTDYVEVQ